MLFKVEAPPAPTVLLTWANCFTRLEKSVTQAATLHEVGTLYRNLHVGCQVV